MKIIFLFFKHLKKKNQFWDQIHVSFFIFIKDYKNSHVNCWNDICFHQVCDTFKTLYKFNLIINCTGKKDTLGLKIGKKFIIHQIKEFHHNSDLLSKI